MTYHFLDTLTTPAVKAAQATYGSGDFRASFDGDRTFDRLTENEIAFIAQRDSFYLASVSENGWPYVQHRGGPAGFLHVVDDRTLAFADYRGNRQYISAGNLTADDRAALFLMDYPRRARLKILAHVEIKSLASDPDLASKLVTPGYRAKPERLILLHLEAFDWNCSQHITPRFTEAELAPALAPIREHIAELEAENKELRERLARVQSTAT